VTSSVETHDVKNIDINKPLHKNLSKPRIFIYSQDPKKSGKLLLGESVAYN
jgi:hypothetical protein